MPPLPNLTTFKEHRPLSRDDVLFGNAFAALNVTEKPAGDAGPHGRGAKGKKVGAAKGEKTDPDELLITKSFDINTKEQRTPVFTREVLRRIASDVQRALLEQSKGPHHRSINSLQYRLPDGKSVTIWKADDDDDFDDDDNFEYGVYVEYMTSVEMHPKFQEEFGRVHRRLRDLRELNDQKGYQANMAIVVPYWLTTTINDLGTAHLNPRTISNMRARIYGTKHLWQSSLACKQLCDLVTKNARQVRTITKIVCVGLGRLRPEPGWYSSALQHITVFSIAYTLDQLNRTKNPHCAPVEIIAQDPEYRESDRIVLPELASRPINFSLTDPETLLEIDANTLVVTAFLPFTVPLMEIIADMSAEKGDGPAMMLCDHLRCLSVKQKLYCLRHRSSPRVARFMLRYDEELEPFTGWDDKLRENVCAYQEKPSAYWLESMRLYVKKDDWKM